MRFFGILRLKHKLLVAFLAALVPVVVIGGYIAHIHIERTYMRVIQHALRTNADNVVQMVETTANVAIRNYLRAVAEHNLGVLTQFWEDYQIGNRERGQTIAAVHRLLTAQRIGQTGYIYCVDSRGDIVYHPHKAVQGRNLRAFSFIQEQIGRREGYMAYEWQNPGETDVRAKVLYMVYFEPLDWIVSISAYRDEFKHLVQTDDLKENIGGLRFGNRGYAFLLNGHGEVLIHPHEQKPHRITDFIEDATPSLDLVLKRKSGEWAYAYRDPVSGQTIRKIAYLNYIPDFDWLVGTTHSLEDIYSPLKTIRSIILLSAVCLVIITALVAGWFSSYANAHINGLIAAFGHGARGHFKERLPIRAKDEFGKLAHYFNQFMTRLESYQRDLLEEVEKRREIQNTVFANEQRIKNIVQNAPVLLWAVDRDGRLTFHEGALCLWNDPSDGSVIGQSLASLWSDWKEVPTYIEAALEGRSGLALMEKSGGAMEIHYSPLYNIRQAIEGAVGVAIDVTSRVLTQRRLDLSEQERQKLVMAMEQAAEIVIITDREGVIEYVNPAFEKTSGYGKSEVIGQKPAILKSGRHDAVFYEALWRTISIGKVWSGRFINRTKDGALYYEDATIAPLFDESGRIVNFVASKRDVTNEIDLERQLQHAERMKAIGTLAGGIAHDFNNILSGILGYTELCRFDVPPGSRMRERLDKVVQACSRAKELIGHMQTFSRQKEVTPIVVMPAPIVEEALRLIRASFPPAIVLKGVIRQVGSINAVPAQLHQIVMNLCTNACHAMQPDGGALMVNLLREVLDAASAKKLLDLAPGDYVKLVVSDTGPGIATDIIDRIFDPYFTTKSEGEGTGLGLSVVHGIVLKMGGAIKVDSEVGRGTTFTVLMPVIDNRG